MSAYVWTDVLYGHHGGMAAIEAESVEDAYRQVRSSDIPQHVKDDLLTNEPKQLDSGEVEYSFG